MHEEGIFEINVCTENIWNFTYLYRLPESRIL